MRTTKAQREAAERAVALAAHFTPGNVIFGNYWRSHDLVVAFRPSTESTFWSVDVVASDEHGTPKQGERVRNHATYPDKRDKIVATGATIPEGLSRFNAYSLHY